MITDALVNFWSPNSAPLSIVAGAGIATPSNVYDMIGSGPGTPQPNIIGTRTLFGSDYGIGGNKPQVEAVVGTAFATANAATLNVAFQAAVDTGAAGGWQPGAWLTLVETGPIAVANLTAQQVLARFDFPPAFPPGTLPRYLRLLFQVAAATNFTAGTIAFAIVTMVRDDQSNKFASKNYSVQ